MITTRNRRNDVLRAVASCFGQYGATLEVLIYDDASSDGTVEAVRKAWPQARVIECRKRAGLVVNRNRGFQDAHADVIFSLDDDAYFSSRDAVARIVTQLFNNPDAGAVAVPYMEPREKRSISSQTTTFAARPGTELRSYTGCAHAVRRQAALEAGGYREFFVHQHEEREFCIRLRAADWRIIYGDCEPVVHMVSPRRDRSRMTFYGGRNQILVEFLNTPFPDVVWRIVAGSIGFIRYRFSLRALPNRLKAIMAGCRDAVTHRALRKPVGREFYRNHRRLPAHGPIDWQGPVPAPCHDCNPAP